MYWFYLIFFTTHQTSSLLPCFLSTVCEACCWLILQIWYVINHCVSLTKTKTVLSIRERKMCPDGKMFSLSDVFGCECNKSPSSLLFDTVVLPFSFSSVKDLAHILYNIKKIFWMIFHTVLLFRKMTQKKRGENDARMTKNNTFY